MNFIDSSAYRGDLEAIVKSIPKKSFTVLVTGATGLIGSCMVDALLYANQVMGCSYTVYAMGRDEKRLKARFQYWQNTSRLFFLVQDVREPFESSLQLDYIVNLASLADPRSYALFPVETIAVNVIGTYNLLEFCRNHPNTDYLCASSMEVYGSIPGKATLSEDDYGLIDFNRVRSGYPESKRNCELLCRSYAEQHQVRAMIARLGYIYGPTMQENDSKVIAQFIRRMIVREDIVLKSEGRQKRAFCYITDAVSGLFHVLLEGRQGEAYNIASSSSIASIRDLAHLSAELAGSNVVHAVSTGLEAKGSALAQDNVLDSGKLESIGWQPVYSLREGLRRTMIVLRECDKL